MSSGGSSTPETTTTIQAPPKYIEPYLKEAANAASDEFANGPVTPYSGSTVLDFNNLQTQSMQGMIDMVNSGDYTALNNNAIDANTYAMQLPQNIQDDPTLKAMADANAQAVQENLVENTLRDVRGSSINAGGYDSTRTGIAEGNAIEGAAQELANANASMYSTAFDNSLKTAQVAQQNVPTLQAGMMQPYQISGTVGDAYASLDQARAYEDEAKYYQEQNAEYQNILDYANLLAGTSSGGSTTTTAPGTPGPSSASQLLGAASTGLGAYGAMGASTLATPVGWGAAAASLLL